MPDNQVLIPCHFGEWLQGRIGSDGPLALVSLMPARTFLHAQWRAGLGLQCHAIGHGPLQKSVVAQFARAVGGLPPGRVLLRLPYPPGLGTGMSTAALLALAAFSARSIAPLTLARACVDAEGASDPLMFPQAARLLWASRQGKVLAALPPQPHAHLLAGFWGPARPTQASDHAYEDVSDLVQLWQEGKGLAACAALARESARRCLALRGPSDDPTDALARDLGALGWSMSHSGAARALIFAPGQVPRHGADRLREAGLHGVHLLATPAA